jgi:hypothetical protein
MQQWIFLYVFPFERCGNGEFTAADCVIVAAAMFSAYHSMMAI